MARGQQRALQAVRVGPAQNAVELWEAVCAPGGLEGDGPKLAPGAADTPLLLLPEGYEFLDEAAAPEQMAELLMVPPKMPLHHDASTNFAWLLTWGSNCGLIARDEI